MEDKHRRLIQTNYTELVSAIKLGAEDVSKDLRNKRIFTERGHEEVEAARTPTEKAQKILDTLVCRGPNAFNEFYESVKKFELFGAANILNPNRDHWTQNSNEDGKNNLPNAPFDSMDFEEINNELQNNWPPQEAQTSFDVTLVSQNSFMFAEYQKSFSFQSSYQMKNSPRGRVLIINNINFIHLPYRRGSEKDEEGLINVFNQLGFKVFVQNDKTCCDMKDILQKESEIDHSTFDCFVLVILTHGCPGGVYGIDGKANKRQPENYLKLKDIRDIFDGSRTLLNKPKLFFIQACQGEKRNEGRTNSEDSDGSITADSDLDAKNVARTMEEVFPSEEADDGQKVPKGIDFFIAMSTIKEYLSVRHVIYGTWFIQALLRVLAKLAHCYDIDRLMTLVINMVSKAESSMGYQVCKKKSTLKNDFYFFPGLGNESARHS